MPDANGQRLLSLDAFRGITIAGMVLVNNPGSWDSIYSPLEHAEWNGWTPTDLVFPFFLFIVGVAMTLSLGKRVETGGSKRDLYLKIFRRAALIFVIGLILNTFPFYDFAKGEWLDVGMIRIMGVLQRIAICYLVASILFLHTSWREQLTIGVGLLIIYWFLMTMIDVPGCLETSVNLKPCNLAAFIDRSILTENHMWQQSKVYDPEGLLSTIPAIVTTIIGMLTGKWLRSEPPASAGGQSADEPGNSTNRLAAYEAGSDKVAAIFFFGTLLVALGWIWNFWFPINKRLWTGSYVLFTAGLALCFLGACYWLIDIKKFQAWAKPFFIFGANAIALYIGSEIMAVALGVIRVAGPDGQPMALQDWIFNNVFLTWASPVNASLAFAICFILVWLFLMWLLYRRRIFIRL
jgi:predicted acyltransferase